MFIGETGAGKSHAARDLLDDEGLPVLLVNDHTDDRLRPLHTRIPWNLVLEAAHCNVLVEDLIDVTEKEVSVLQKIINYNAHHRVLPTVVFIAHSSSRTGAFTTLKHMTHFCFMTKRSSAASVAHVLQLFKIRKTDAAEKLDAFLADLGRVERGYWVLEVETGKFGRKPGSLAPGVAAGSLDPSAASTPSTPSPTLLQKREALLPAYRKTAEAYLPLLVGGGVGGDGGKKAMALFDFLMIASPLESLNAGNLDYTLRDAKTGRVVRVSLFDYLHTLTTQARPRRDVLDLHAYIGRHITLPRCFIVNKHPKFRDNS